jgi:hypothetical protein
MAEIKIILNSTQTNTTPKYVDSTPTYANWGDTIIFEARNSDFQVIIKNANIYFNTSDTKLIYPVSPSKPARTPQIKMGLDNLTAITYDVYCNTNSDYAFDPPTDAPPKIIVGSIVDRSR